MAPTTYEINEAAKQRWDTVRMEPYDPQHVLLKMCQFLGDKALKSTRTHTACTNGVRTKGHDFWTYDFSMIPRNKGLFLVYSRNNPNNPRSTRSECFTIPAFQSRP
jgi:hypothetical protein